jgi:hypothetical protein
VKRFDGRILAGVILIGFGFLFFLQTMGWIPYVGIAGLWAFLFGVAGLAFLWVFLRDRDQWWAILPGLPLLGLGSLLLLDALSFPLAFIGPALLLGSISAAFFIVYAVRRDFWWAIIPGGTIASVTSIVLLEQIVPGEQAVGIMFLGIGLTFLALYYLPADRGRQAWAIYPGGILLIMAALFGLAFGVVGRFLVPAALVALGILLVYRAGRASPPSSNPPSA